MARLTTDAKSALKTFKLLILVQSLTTANEADIFINNSENNTAYTREMVDETETKSRQSWKLNISKPSLAEPRCMTQIQLNVSDSKPEWW